MRIPPLELKILLESNPLKSRILVLVQRLAVDRALRSSGASAGARPHVRPPRETRADAAVPIMLYYINYVIEHVMIIM